MRGREAAEAVRKGGAATEVGPERLARVLPAGAQESLAAANKWGERGCQGPRAGPLHFYEPTAAAAASEAGRRRLNSALLARPVILVENVLLDSDWKLNPKQCWLISLDLS